jgi:hypothetical protein
VPHVSFTKRELLRGKIVDPAWYVLQIEAVGEELSKDKGSTNYPVEATVVMNADNGDTKFEGVPIEWNFNSKAIGFARGFLESFGVELEADKRFELAAANGKEIDVFVENGEYLGRMQNRVNHKYRPARSNMKTE